MSEAARPGRPMRTQAQAPAMALDAIEHLAAFGLNADRDGLADAFAAPKLASGQAGKEG
jgi:hypothetical protein